MKKICFITSSRADYGLLSSLIFRVKKSKNLKLQILATGSHLSKKYSYTIQEIIDDGFVVDQKVVFNTNESTHINNQISETIKKIHISLKKLKPHAVIILGDRFEIFAAAIASFFLKIPIIHIHGGEVTQGAFDDNLRHSITKFASLHFVSNNTHKKRVVQLGEDPSTVYNVGSLGVDNIKNIKFISKIDLEKKYNFTFRKKNIVVSLHPETFEENKKYIQEFILSLNEIKKIKNIFIFLTGSNLDPDSKKISTLFKNFNKKNSDISIYIESLGKKDYLSLLKYADLIIGNSSSGIIEAPSLKTKTLNIGNRQKGRLQSRSVYNCEFKKNTIMKMVFRLLKENKKDEKNFFHNLYEKQQTSKNIMTILKKKLKKKNEHKVFFDL